MKKKICVLVLTFISIVSLFYANTIKVEADTVESMSYGDMIIRTARANGDTSTYLSLADTTVMYGNIENNFIEKFTSFYAPESWSASLGNNGDNAFAENWRIQSKNNIGVILEIKAKKDINVTSSYAAVKGWIDDSNLNVYLKSNNNIELLNSKTLSGYTDNTSVTIDDFAINVNLKAGDVLYYEFISIGDSYRNLQDINAMYFTFKEGSEEELPDVTPTVATEKIKYSDVIVKTAENEGKITTGELMQYGLFYGNVTTAGASINMFDEFTLDGKGGATLGNSSDLVYCPNAGKVFYKESGVVLKITALVDITLDTYRSASYGLGWVEHSTLAVFVESNASITQIVNSTLSASTTAEAFSLSDINLAKGDSLYYVLIFQWDYRNTENLEHFIIEATYEMPHEHNYGEWHEQLNPTCEENGTLGHYLCNCGKYFDLEYNEIVDIIIPASHTYSEIYSTNDTHHWYNATCLHKNEKIGYEEHNFDNGVITVEPTTTVEGIKTYTCTTCGFVKTENLGTSDCEHTFTTEFSFDELGHWNAATCGCDEIRNYSEHTLNWYTLEEGNYLVDKVEEGRCECGYFETKTTPSTIDFPDYSTLDSVSLNDLAIYNAIYEGQALSLANMSINLRQGNIMINNLSGFEKYSCNISYKDNGEQSINVLIGALDEEGFLSESSAAFSTWRMRTTLSKHAIFEVTATSDIMLDITHEAFSGGWIDEHGQFIGIYLLSDGKVYTISLKDIKENYGDANQYGGSLMLKEGDVCYWVFGSTIALQRNVDLVPEFTANKEAFDETIYKQQMILEDETVAMWDALTASINNNYDAVSYNLINFGFGYGTLKDIQKFNYHVGDGTGTAEDALWDSVTMSAGFLRWQIQCDLDKDAIIVITANEDVSLTVNHNASTWSNVWSTHTAIRYYVVDSDGTRVLVLDKAVESKVPQDFFAITVNLLKGQSLIIDYYTKNESWGSLDIAPVVTASCTSFDPNGVVDFSSVRRLASKIEAAIDSINTKFDEINRDDYSLSSLGKIENYYDEAIKSLESAQTEEDVINAVNTFDENIGSVATKADEQAVLNEVKTKAIKELNDLVNSLNQSSYTKENWTLINTKLEDATKKINNATSQTSVNTLLASAKAYINNVKPLENQASSGCAGSVISTSGILVILFAAVCLFKNKKEDTINSK